ncbi:MAG: UvrD-helicase domain-containing protein [Planctomycetes bacterium]|nr:UvrD-helicase domain-containing protein [Planctomycetota bacterium]
MTNFEPVQIIQALAGSGKTQLLAYRFIRLMQFGFEPETILATTFSRKAAGEIRDRIVEMLSEAILQPNKLKELRDKVPEINNVEDCVVLLQKLVAALQRLNIGTIDSFFVKTALAFSDMLEFTQGWSILDEVNEERIFGEAVTEFTKDKAIADQMASKLYLSRSGAKVPISNTLRAIKDDAFLGIRGADASVWTWGKRLNPLSQDEVDEYILRASQLDLAMKSQRNALAKAIINMRNGDWKAFLTSGMAPKVIEGSSKFSRAEMDPRIEGVYTPLISHGLAVMANCMLDKNESTYKLMKEFQAYWMHAKHACGLYSFDDVTYSLGASSAMDCLDEARLLELHYRMDGAIDHLLIDEFQDTSLTQWAVLEPIVQEINQSMQNRSLFFVGDVKQSLYGFRGGEPALLRGLESELQTASTDRLKASWRCTPPVLDAVNTVFGNVENAQLLTEHSPDAAELWLQDFDPHVSAPPTKKKRGYAVLQTASENPSKSDLQNCVDKVVEVVAKIHTDAPAATVGILVRGNQKQQIQRIVHGLRTSDVYVPASEFGGNPLTDSPAVTLILSVLLFADDCGNTVHKFLVEQSPLGPCIENISGNAIRRELLTHGYAKLINTYAESLVEYVEERERLRLWQLVEFAEQYASDKSLRPSDFVRLVEETQVPDPASSQVQVMTVHKSKGLSFDAVVVCDLDTSLWKSPGTLEFHKIQRAQPTRVGMYASEFLDEAIPEYKTMREESHSNQVNDALCLLYVAMTRAKHALHMIVPSKNGKTTRHKTLAGLLLQILDFDRNQDPDTILWEAAGNDSAWTDAFKIEQQQKACEIPEFSILPPKNPTMLGKGLASASPSSLEGGGKTKIGERFKGGTNSAFDWGTITHKWFEDIAWLDGVLPSVDSLMVSAPVEEAGRLGPKRLEDAATVCLNALQSEDIQNLLTKPTENLSVYREQEFVLRVQKGTKFAEVEMKEPTDLRGTIDRLVVYYDENGKASRAQVIDWKTDKIQDSSVSELIAHYAPQLASYRLAAAKLLGISVETVSADLVFLAENKVENITEKASVTLP